MYKLYIIKINRNRYRMRLRNKYPWVFLKEFMMIVVFEWKKKRMKPRKGKSIKQQQHKPNVTHVREQEEDEKEKDSEIIKFDATFKGSKKIYRIIFKNREDFDHEEMTKAVLPELLIDMWKYHGYIKVKETSKHSFRLISTCEQAKIIDVIKQTGPCNVNAPDAVLFFKSYKSEIKDKIKHNGISHITILQDYIMLSNKSLDEFIKANNLSKVNDMIKNRTLYINHGGVGIITKHAIIKKISLNDKIIDNHGTKISVAEFYNIYGIKKYRLFIEEHETNPCPDINKNYIVISKDENDCTYYDIPGLVNLIMFPFDNDNLIKEATKKQLMQIKQNANETIRTAQTMGEEITQPNCTSPLKSTNNIECIAYPLNNPFITWTS